jgi:hypothetical protein
MTTQQQYELLHKALNEQQWRLYLGTEALKIGYGGISQVAALSGADWKTVQRGVKELKGERARAEGRIRQAGGGRKKATETDSTLQRDLEELLSPKGDPMSLVKWTTHAPFAPGQGALASLGIASRRRLWPSCYTRRAIPVIRQQENDGRRFPLCWLLVASASQNWPVRTPHAVSCSLLIPHHKSTISSIKSLIFTKR